MNVTEKHTPTPWSVEVDSVTGDVDIFDADAKQFMTARDAATGSFIVRACNAFDSMHLALAMVADTLPFQFMEPETQKLVMDALVSASSK
jgi:hypothetical protein